MPYKYFVPSGFPKFVEDCLRVLRSGEVGVILFNSKMDRPLRINQLIQDYQNEYPLIKVDLTPDLTGSLNYVLPSIEQQIGVKLKKDVGICVTNCELFIFEENYTVIQDIVQLQQKSPHYRFLLFFEIDITHPDIASRFSLNEVFNNVIYYPLYDYADSLKFIDYSLNEWQFQLTNSIKEKIIDQCGGQFWLIRQMVRAFRDDPKITFEQVLDSEPIRFRLEQIYLFLLDSEKKVLQKIMRGEPVEENTEKHSLTYLKRMGFIKGNKITIPLLEKYIREDLPRPSIELQEKHISINNVNIEENFSKKERRALKLLLENKNNIVTREKIAQALWPVNMQELYTDWALDRFIARIRIKLKKLGVSKELIKTLRNKGYMLVN